MDLIETANLFSEKKWIGEFFLPGSFDNRFLGEINYSPENGIILSYTIVGYDLPPNSKILHGVLSTGEKCTLIDSFSPKYSGSKSKNGLTTRNGKSGFIFLIIGDWFAKSDKLGQVSFSLTNLQEFFFFHGDKDFVKYSKESIYSIEAPFGSLEITTLATFNWFNNDIESLVYSNEPEALKSLSKVFEELKINHPEALFLFKKDISYEIVFKFSPELTVDKAYDHIADISNLFALLTHTPVYPNSISFKKSNDVDRPIVHDLYASLVLDPRTIELCTNPRSHLHMPITQHTVTLDTVISSWLKNSQVFSTIITAIQHETGFRDEHTAHGEIILYSAQFESISYDSGETEDKYSYPLQEYACSKLCDGLSKIFNTTTIHETGEAIRELRNEIAHMRRPRNQLVTLTLTDLVHISQHLQLTIIGKILTSLNIPSDIIRRYQETYSPDL